MNKIQVVYLETTGTATADSSALRGSTSAATSTTESTALERKEGEWEGCGNRVSDM